MNLSLGDKVRIEVPGGRQYNATLSEYRASHSLVFTVDMVENGYGDEINVGILKWKDTARPTKNIIVSRIDIDDIIVSGVKV